MTSQEKQDEFLENFYQKIAGKIDRIASGDLDIDCESLCDWFIDYAIVNKLDEFVMEKFSKLFAQLMFIHILKDAGCIIEIDNPDEIPAIKSFIKKLEK